MSQLQSLRELLGNPPESDAILQFYLDRARDIICDIRNSNLVETKYMTTQLQMAIEMYNKSGAEGQTAHSENGMVRTYEASDISPSLLAKVTPIAKTPFSSVRMV